MSRYVFGTQVMGELVGPESPGGGILIYTDGLPEARTAREVDRHVLFGEQAARDTLIGLQGAPPADILAGLRAAAVRHAEGLPADDLCLRAARALQRAGGVAAGVDLSIDKVLPSGAGMGGGSSDAASTLLALNRLWGLDWPLDRLLPIGLALGTDCLYAWQWFERASAAQRAASRGGLFDTSVSPTAGRRALSLRIRLCRTAQASLDDLVAAHALA